MARECSFLIFALRRFRAKTLKGPMLTLSLGAKVYRWCVIVVFTEHGGGITDVKDRVCVFWSAPIGELMRQQ